MRESDRGRESNLPHQYQIFHGEVASLQTYGAFVKIPGCKKQGLVHKSQMSTSKIDDPSEMLAKGEKIYCKVISVEVESEKISLSMKVVNQTTGKDLDPNNVQASQDEKRRRQWNFKGNNKIELGHELNTTCRKCGGHGHLAIDCFVGKDGVQYDLIPDIDKLMELPPLEERQSAAPMKKKKDKKRKKKRQNSSSSSESGNDNVGSRASKERKKSKDQKQPYRQQHGSAERDRDKRSHRQRYQSDVEDQEQTRRQRHGSADRDRDERSHRQTHHSDVEDRDHWRRTESPDIKRNMSSSSHGSSQTHGQHDRRDRERVNSGGSKDRKSILNDVYNEEKDNTGVNRSRDRQRSNHHSESVHERKNLRKRKASSSSCDSNENLSSTAGKHFARKNEDDDRSHRIVEKSDDVSRSRSNSGVNHRASRQGREGKDIYRKGYDSSGDSDEDVQTSTGRGQDSLKKRNSSSTKNEKKKHSSYSHRLSSSELETETTEKAKNRTTETGKSHKKTHSRKSPSTSSSDVSSDHEEERLKKPIQKPRDIHNRKKSRQSKDSYRH